VWQQRRKAPVPEPRLPEDAPEGVKQFVVRLLQKRPWHRYELAADARRAWRKFAPIHDAPTTPYSTAQLSGPSIAPSAEASQRDMAGEMIATSTTVGLLGLRPAPFVARTHERQRLLEVAAQVAAK